ncbi:hypothetical protein DICSQDRAFT_169950 [Dichomitus squalens LYAD-421 SS1]|uniref:Uncharacterized protein n=1 Tax=Dichomitus squalens (strain LYAD-421) TaxID=732165 RepID=R7T0L7_DICSQ|nr:uncharacterized protein DICSQDRAFT_169950 [Dichomitus squalens LYAD-421 SS1]EJF61530.1 hypothetical protein DICSQDRAFT_169950 [Dichomitus squalens LYAD-421 SS1]
MTPSHSQPPSLSSSIYDSVVPSLGLLCCGSTQEIFIHRPVSGFSRSTFKAHLGFLVKQILQADPMFKAFENAQTQISSSSNGLEQVK